jgi:lipopolysaccharide transport system ATP-binding protein
VSSHSTALQCVNVSKTYAIQDEIRLRSIFFDCKGGDGKLIHALKNISMTVPKGKVVGILGRNGAGKSTLLRVLGGVYHPSGGQIKTIGQIAGLFELGGLGSPELTGREFVIRYLAMLGISKHKHQELIEDIHEFSELEEAFDQKIRTYSSGMGARLYFSTLTSVQQDIYLIDELLSVGDFHFQAKSWQRMRQRLTGGASGVLVTHDWASVLKLCEETNIINKGEFIFSGPSDQAVVQYLNLPVPEAKVARFAAKNSPTHTARAGEDTVIPIYIDVLDSQPVDLSVSIEMLRIGIGWEIVLLSDKIPVAKGQGNYMLHISVPKLPLAPGKYSLNVFLSKSKTNPADATEGLDARTWTLGNGFSLEVQGKTQNAAVGLPFSVRKLGATV